ncbi:TadE family protein [Crateriforma conspicua]|uniref:TadE-like protein n=1 Tax=Crateriforma conspicua TaxID=2527996 RepID=A0A5C5Y1K8_9PLAN|nr:TadE family protein [Crateriforma conspicua]TWT68195.1 TadE-like protein [Crateriforma conspicua]
MHANRSRKSQLATPRRRRNGRRAAAVVELAVCLPLLTLIMLGTIETCNMMFVGQSLKITAYEGARVGVVPTSKAENVEYQCQLLLDAHGVKGYDVSMNPSDPGALGEDDYFQVTVSAPFDSNSLLGGYLFSGKTLTRTVSLRAR